MRSDGRHNRDRIVAAARELIAEQGPDVVTEQVARRAAVGIATVYRHFPDRPSLVRGVALDCFERVVEIARAAEDEEGDAWHALSRFIHQAAVELRLATWISIWFASAWTDLRNDPQNQRLRRVLMSILDRLVRTAQDDGALRPDVGAVDLAMMLALLLRPIPGLPAELAQQSVERHLALMIDGLRPGAETRLPGRGSTLADLLGPHDP